ncbi:hypothetical protein K458DRAFT_469875 [Lentithecium fluviatile CBS 122367]|uniref:Uncharacterized protein n=1 Tax=Lentithecium fluviatile CBS 122367 TaxID=1168545 RepID=A0A6G1IDF6_9PLEO|nr:hypothetical protein K458DRAFT_469875 [Lentithecium fluviatile CBS 122367]
MARGGAAAISGHNFPSKNLAFPPVANITAVELLTFLPECLMSVDVVYRFASNDATRNVILTIVTTCRVFQKQWSKNTCGNTMYTSIRRAGFEKWTIGVHEEWHADRSAIWNQADPDVAGFRTPSKIHEGGAFPPAILFADLANVRQFPVDADALDLSRMVQYCVEHPEEEWAYPNEYGLMLSLLGGRDR